MGYRSRLFQPMGLSLALFVSAPASAESVTSVEKPRPRPTVAQVFEVAGAGASADAARALAGALGIDAGLREEDGSLRFIRPDRFLFAPTAVLDEEGRDEHGHPTTTSGFDAEALRRIKALPDKEAIRRARTALDGAGLLPASTAPSATNAKLELFGTDAKRKTTTALDTSVTFRAALNGILVGYATTSWDAEGQGEGFAARAIGVDQAPMSIVNAWGTMVSEIQWDVEYAAMGPSRTEIVAVGGGQIKTYHISNYGDFFWDRGPTGPDIIASGPFGGYWVLSVPVE